MPLQSFDYVHLIGIYVEIVGVILIIPFWWWTSRLPYGNNFSKLWRKYEVEVKAQPGSEEQVNAIRKAIKESQKEIYRILQKIGIIAIIVGLLLQAWSVYLSNL